MPCTYSSTAIYKDQSSTGIKFHEVMVSFALACNVVENLNTSHLNSAASHLAMTGFKSEECNSLKRRLARRLVLAPSLSNRREDCEDSLALRTGILLAKTCAMSRSHHKLLQMLVISTSQAWIETIWPGRVTWTWLKSWNMTENSWFEFYSLWRGLGVSVDSYLAGNLFCE